MPLIGSAAMLLSFDVDPDAVDEHDRWHTHEHLPERLSIPGFERGTRWVAPTGPARYMVLYEVSHLAVLSSEAYLARLNQPTPWTQRIMPFYRGMSRGLCSVIGSFGYGQGGVAALIRFTPDEGREGGLNDWLLREVLAAVPTGAGLGSAHLLQGAQAASMTNEQRLRGPDLGVHGAIIVTGYSADAVADWAEGLCSGGALAEHGARAMPPCIYGAAYSLSRAELQA